MSSSVMSPAPHCPPPLPSSLLFTSRRITEIPPKAKKHIIPLPPKMLRCSQRNVTVLSETSPSPSPSKFSSRTVMSPALLTRGGIRPLTHRNFFLIALSNGCHPHRKYDFLPQAKTTKRLAFIRREPLSRAFLILVADSPPCSAAAVLLTAFIILPVNW